MLYKLIKNATIVNEGQVIERDILIEGNYIVEIDKAISPKSADTQIIDAEFKYVLPGIIDDQVHFREPGLTSKATIETESKAAVAGGITTFIEMPNTVPPAITNYLVEEKFKIAEKTSLANYSFMIGGTNDNLEELLKTDPKKVAGIKLFLGSSTGNMLVNNKKVIEQILSKSPMLIAVHCEDEELIKKNLALFKKEYGDEIPMHLHPQIRSEEACYLSSSSIIKEAKKHGARLHVFHLSTGKETNLFTNKIPLEKKRITSEVCIHHLFFDDADYDKKGAFIKWNPAVKTAKDKEMLWDALLTDKIDVIATDHAPHTLEEKQQPYTQCPSGGPLVQHGLAAMLTAHRQGKISIEKIVEKMCHNPAKIFQVEKRGFIKEGYFADLVIVDKFSLWTVTKENILYKCKWSPFEGKTFQSKVTHTFVNGHLAFANDTFDESVKGKRIEFER